MTKRFSVFTLISTVALLINLSSCKQGNQVVKSDLVNQEQAINLNETENYQFVDLRTPAEIAEGQINGSLNINFKGESFNSQIDNLDRNGKYILYCRSGGRSGKTYKKMKALGFKNIKDLDGGYSQWKN